MADELINQLPEPWAELTDEQKALATRHCLTVAGFVNPTATQIADIEASLSQRPVIQRVSLLRALEQRGLKISPEKTRTYLLEVIKAYAD